MVDFAGEFGHFHGNLQYLSLHDHFKRDVLKHLFKRVGLKHLQLSNLRGVGISDFDDGWRNICCGK